MKAVRYRLEDVAIAQDHLEHKHARGKTVINVQADGA
jgi:hypothetical protein